EDSVRTIAENLDSKQPEILQKNIDRLTVELKTVKRNIARYDTLINQAAERENEIQKFGELELTPLEGTMWLKKNEEHSWLPDEVNPNTEFPLTNEQLIKFFELLRTLSREDINSLSLNIPSSSMLPDPNSFSQKVDELLHIEERIDQTSKDINGWSPKDLSTVELDQWINRTNTTINRLRELQSNKWLVTIIEDCLKDPEQTNYWLQFINEVRETINDIQLLEKELIEHTFIFPSSKSLLEIKEDLLNLKEKLSANSKVGWFYKNVS